jgi:hypothetical protein
MSILFVTSSLLLSIKARYKNNSVIVDTPTPLYKPNPVGSNTTTISPPSTKYYTSDVTDYLEPIVDSTGANSIPPETVFSLFRKTVEKDGSRIAMALKRQLPNVHTYCQLYQYSLTNQS